METQKNDKPVVGHGIYHPGARPMEVLADQDGCWWLCDKGVDRNKDFEAQGCWRCRDIQFTRND